MNDYKPRFTNRYDVSMDGIYSLDLPDGTYKMIDQAFKKWELRRGFVTEEEQKKCLRGRAYRYGQFKNHSQQQEQKPVEKVAAPQIKTKKKAVKKKTVAKKKILVKKKTIAKKKTKKVVKKK